jgi:hypothetical protein
MSWITTDSITIQSQNIKRIERKKKKSIYEPKFDFSTGAPMENSTTKPKFNYVLITSDNKEIDIDAKDFVSIRHQLNKINEKEIKFLELKCCLYEIFNIT